ncbi:MAG: hypothetical protein SOZ34_04020 [Clostridia bacterium]|nr:hypothetical protein [Clostridia bacterium]
MNKGEFAKGIAAGLVVGAAAAIMIDPISDRQKNRIKRKTAGVFKSIGSVIDTAVDLMR